VAFDIVLGSHFHKTIFSRNLNPRDGTAINIAKDLTEVPRFHTLTFGTELALSCLL
jgi:hypothetical protein